MLFIQRQREKVRRTCSRRSERHDLLHQRIPRKPFSLLRNDERLLTVCVNSHLPWCFVLSLLKEEYWLSWALSLVLFYRLVVKLLSRIRNGIEYTKDSMMWKTSSRVVLRKKCWKSSPRTLLFQSLLICCSRCVMEQDAWMWRKRENRALKSRWSETFAVIIYSISNQFSDKWHTARSIKTENVILSHALKLRYKSFKGRTRRTEIQIWKYIRKIQEHLKP
jgi:hypothetical protein